MADQEGVVDPKASEGAPKLNSFFKKIFDNKLFSFYSDPLLHFTVNHAKIYNNYQNVKKGILCKVF